MVSSRREIFSMNLTRVKCLIWLFEIALVAVAQAGESTFQISAESPHDKNSVAVIRVHTYDGTAQQNHTLPVRVIVTAVDGTHPDGSGYGVYSDGRFFSDGVFEIVVAPGRTTLEISSGPQYKPLKCAVNAKAGIRTQLDVSLNRWFDPTQRGWYSGDNHVHAQHDPTATVQTGLAYAALQARSNGLNFITEAGSNVSYEHADQLDTPDFLLRVAREIRPACYTGHFITPGITEPIAQSLVDTLAAECLPGQALKREVHARGGVLTYTHPLTPPHQLHWMGATGALSDAVSGNCGDLMDLDSPQTEQLWFTLLNMGVRIGASSYTDCSLGRLTSLSPGDRRIYCRAPALDYPALVKAMSEGRTFATNGGPIFPFFTIDNRGPGSTLEYGATLTHRADLEVQSLHTLRSIEVIRNGVVFKTYDATAQAGPFRTTWDLSESEDCWYVVRVENEHGEWGITSPIYFASSPASAPQDAAALVLAIANADRYTGLRREFFAHFIVTLSNEQRIESVTLLRDGEPVHSFLSADGDSLLTGKAPVTTLNGDYQAAWRWHGESGPTHFQADWPVGQTGWYSLEIQTASGTQHHTDALFFDASNPNSHAIGVAHLRDGQNRFVQWGYGEEMPLADVIDPFTGDHWWYPKRTFWRIVTDFKGTITERTGGANEGRGLFRAYPNQKVSP